MFTFYFAISFPAFSESVPVLEILKINDQFIQFVDHSNPEKTYRKFGKFKKKKVENTKFSILPCSFVFQVNRTQFEVTYSKVGLINNQVVEI